MNVLFTTNQVGFSGTPLKRRNSRTVNFEHDLLFSDIDYVDAIFIDYGEEAARQWRELSNFCCWILWEVLLTNELLYLLINVAAVKTIEEWTLVSERYKLQLLQGPVFLVLVGQRRLLGVFVHELIMIGLFLEILLSFLVVVALALFLRRLVLLLIRM